MQNPTQGYPLCGIDNIVIDKTPQKSALLVVNCESSPDNDGNNDGMAVNNIRKRKMVRFTLPLEDEAIGKKVGSIPKDAKPIKKRKRPEKSQSTKNSKKVSLDTEMKENIAEDKGSVNLQRSVGKCVIL